MSKAHGTVMDRNPLPLNQDYGSYDGAQILVARIKDYWLRRGYDVTTIKVVADMANRSDRDSRYNVRSGMIGGQPC